MPQMSPILWDLIMFLIILFLFLMISKIYFSLNSNKISSKMNNLNKANVKMLNWTW